MVRGYGEKRGRDTDKEVTLGKDLVGVRRIEHSRDVCTALIGFVKGEGDTIITVEKINNGLPYITDSDAFQRWNEKGNINSASILRDRRTKHDATTSFNSYENRVCKTH